MRLPSVKRQSGGRAIPTAVPFSSATHGQDREWAECPRGGRRAISWPADSVLPGRVREEARRCQGRPDVQNSGPRDGGGCSGDWCATGSEAAAGRRGLLCVHCQRRFASELASGTTGASIFNHCSGRGSLEEGAGGASKARSALSPRGQLIERAQRRRVIRGSPRPCCAAAGCPTRCAHRDPDAGSPPLERRANAYCARRRCPRRPDLAGTLGARVRAAVLPEASRRLGTLSR